VRPVDLLLVNDLAALVSEAKPDIVLHAAAVSSVAEAFNDPQKAWRLNHAITAQVAEAIAKRGGRFVQVSTDLVFDGDRAPYRDGDRPEPLSEYGRTKAAAEQAVLPLPRTAVVRVSLMHGPAHGLQPSFFDQLVQSLR